MGLRKKVALALLIVIVFEVSNQIYINNFKYFIKYFSFLSLR